MNNCVLNSYFAYPYLFGNIFGTSYNKIWVFLALIFDSLWHHENMEKKWCHVPSAVIITSTTFGSTKECGEILQNAGIKIVTVDKDNKAHSKIFLTFDRNLESKCVVFEFRRFDFRFFFFRLKRTGYKKVEFFAKNIVSQLILIFLSRRSKSKRVIFTSSG